MIEYPTIRRYLDLIDTVAEQATHTFRNQAFSLMRDLADSPSVAQDLSGLHRNPATPFESFLRQQIGNDKR